MSLKKRIYKLEEKAVSPEWPDVKIFIWATDARITDNPTPQPDSLDLVLHSGEPGKPGQIFYREPGETENDFTTRAGV